MCAAQYCAGWAGIRRPARRSTGPRVGPDSGGGEAELGLLGNWDAGNAQAGRRVWGGRRQPSSSSSSSPPLHLPPDGRKGGADATCTGACAPSPPPSPTLAPSSRRNHIPRHSRRPRIPLHLFPHPCRHGERRDVADPPQCPRAACRLALGGRWRRPPQGGWRPAPARGLPRGKNLHMRESERRHMQAGIRIRPVLPPPLQRRKRARCTRSSTCTGASGMTRTGARMLRPGGGSGPRKPPACARHPLLGLGAGHRGAPASLSRLRQASAPSHTARAAFSPATTRYAGAAADQACGTAWRMTRA